MTPINTDEEKQSDAMTVASVSTLDLSYPCPSVSSVAKTLLPVPNAPISIRIATRADLPFIDSLQKKQSRAVGWMPTMSLEAKIDAAQILIAESACAERVGYLMGQDRYFKRDDVGVIYQMNVVPEYQRSLVAATMLKAQFERSAYGCRLYCCWCAQDLAANKFWEAMGFVPLAFRTGSPTKGAGGSPRTHIFWQKRIRAGDTSTQWWFPSQTGGGAIREDRIVLPIPPGMRWDDAMPVFLPEAKEEAAKVLPSPKREREGGLKPALPNASRGLSRPAFAMATRDAANGANPRTSRETRSTTAPAPKNDPALVAKARELRDRWLEQVNTGAAHIAPTIARYDVCRVIERSVDARASSEFAAPHLLPAA